MFAHIGKADHAGIAQAVVSVVLPVSQAVGCFPIEWLVFGAYVHIKIKVISEPVLTKVIVLEGVPSVTDDALNPCFCEEMGNGGIMISRIQTHVLR